MIPSLQLHGMPSEALPSPIPQLGASLVPKPPMQLLLSSARQPPDGWVAIKPRAPCSLYHLLFTFLNLGDLQPGCEYFQRLFPLRV